MNRAIIKKQFLIEKTIESLLLFVMMYSYLIGKTYISIISIIGFVIMSIMFYILRKRKIWLYKEKSSSLGNLLITLPIVIVFVLATNKVIAIGTAILIMSIIWMIYIVKEYLNHK